jgi:hypothetical protein
MQSGVVAQWFKMSLAIAMAAASVLIVSRYIGDIGRGEDTTTFILMVATYWFAGSVLFIVSGIFKIKMVRGWGQSGK